MLFGILYSGVIILYILLAKDIYKIVGKFSSRMCLNDLEGLSDHIQFNENLKLGTNT